jgi:hypothetical protein
MGIKLKARNTKSMAHQLLKYLVEESSVIVLYYVRMAIYQKKIYFLLLKV